MTALTSTSSINVEIIMKDIINSTHLCVNTVTCTVCK